MLFEPGLREKTPDIGDIQPDTELLIVTKSLAGVAIENSSADTNEELSELVYKTDEFNQYWDLWQTTIDKGIQLHAYNIGVDGSVDSFVELEMLLGATGLVPNVDIFHTDMANAAFLPNNQYVDQVRDSHGLTERIFTLEAERRNEGFWVFASDRNAGEVKRSLYVLADKDPVELIELDTPEDIEGYRLYPGNISDGEYIFGSRGLSPSEFAKESWQGWRQSLPWTFADLTNTFHRAPRDTSNRSILLRLNTYAAPAKDKDRPFSIRVPLFKYFAVPGELNSQDTFLG